MQSKTAVVKNLKRTRSVRLKIVVVKRRCHVESAEEPANALRAECLAEANPVTNHVPVHLNVVTVPLQRNDTASAKNAANLVNQNVLKRARSHVVSRNVQRPAQSLVASPKNAQKVVLNLAANLNVQQIVLSLNVNKKLVLSHVVSLNAQKNVPKSTDLVASRKKLRKIAKNLAVNQIPSSRPQMQLQMMVVGVQDAVQGSLASHASKLGMSQRNQSVPCAKSVNAFVKSPATVKIARSLQSVRNENNIQVHVKNADSN